MFADREFADMSHQIGILSCGAKSSQITRLGSIYWYTVEYGSHLENGRPRAHGAGIASSIGECEV
jgi:phenylalanine-4-hydroxylase